MYGTKREMIDILKIRAGSMDRKIDELEDEVSSLKVVVHDLRQREAPAEEDTSSEHRDPSNYPEFEMGKSQAKDVNKDSAKEDTPVSSPVKGFRHTQSYRKKLVNGKINSTQSTKKVNITGTSQNFFRVMSAENRPSTQRSSDSSTCLLYVGRLAQGTSEDDLRAHLIDSGVSNDKTADVIKLKTRKSLESSFCISLCDSETENIIYDSNKWPEGVRVRPFVQRSSKKQARYHASQYRVPPRFRNNQRGRSRPVFSRLNYHRDCQEQEWETENEYKWQGVDSYTNGCKDYYYNSHNYGYSAEDYSYRW